MKKTLKSIKHKLNSNEFKEFVYTKMDEIHPGASKIKGIIAGQALSSMAVEFLKIDGINIIYNDLDIFKFINSELPLAIEPEAS